MFPRRTKRAATLAVVFAIALGIGLFFFLRGPEAPEEQIAPTTSAPRETTIGSSVQNRTIKAFTFGHGTKKLLFVGGIHGGYEWNSVHLAYTFMDYLEANPSAIPDNLKITVIPSVNPDGVYKIIGKEGRFTAADVPSAADQSPGRFNANNVDLNRNFDCKWQSESTWRNRAVSAGTAPFSEPESRAIRDFVLKNQPAAVIFWHSQANAVYASECKNGILPQTLAIMNAYAKASGYPAVKTFDSYAVTGDAEGWLASINIPAITVELKTHETIEWNKNLPGILALFEYFSR
ncbi:MAG: M14 family metallopeptidase [Patescibacteria group bacterium]